MKRTLFGLFLLTGVFAAAGAAPPGLTVDSLLETTTTILGQDFEYPEGQANITAAVLIGSA